MNKIPIFKFRYKDLNTGNRLAAICHGLGTAQKVLFLIQKYSARKSHSILKIGPILMYNDHVNLLNKEIWPHFNTLSLIFNCKNGWPNHVTDCKSAKRKIRVVKL